MKGGALNMIKRIPRRFWIIGIILAVLLLIIGLFALLRAVNMFFENNRFVFHQVVELKINPPFTIERRIVSPIPSEKPKEEKKSTPRGALLIPQAEAEEPETPASSAGANGSWKGFVSHYSNAGCLGCPEHYDEEGNLYYKTGNGERFDEQGMTIALPCELITSGQVKYGTKARVTNLDTGAVVDVRITDCGGFSKYNRIADLTLGVAKVLGTKTDQTNVYIELL